MSESHAWRASLGLRGKLRGCNNSIKRFTTATTITTDQSPYPGMCKAAAGYRGSGLREGWRACGAPPKFGQQELFVQAVNQSTQGATRGRTYCCRKWPRLILAPMGEQAHSGWHCHCVDRPAVSSLKMPRCPWSGWLFVCATPHWWEQETDHLIETNNHRLLNFRPIIHANAPGECPFVEFFPFAPAFACLIAFFLSFFPSQIDFVFDFACFPLPHSWLCSDEFHLVI